MVTWEQMFTANTRTINPLTARLGCGDGEKKTLKSLYCSNRFDIVREKVSSGFAEPR